MPQLGMGLQSLVSNWVKVNNKHIVFPGANGEVGGVSHHGENDPSATTPRTSQQAQSSPEHQIDGGNGGGSMVGGGSRRRLSHSDSASSVSAAPKPVVGDGRTMLQQRHAPFPNTQPALRSRPGPPTNMPSSSLQTPQRPRQGKRIWGKGDRRLSRSNSQSDLVRSMASQRIRQLQEGGPSDPRQQQHHPNGPLHHPPSQPLPESQKMNGDAGELKQVDEKVGIGASTSTPTFHDGPTKPEGADASLRCAAGFIYGETEGADFGGGEAKPQQRPPPSHSRTNNGGALGTQPSATAFVGAHQNDHSNAPSHYYHRPPYPPDTTDHYINEEAFIRQAEITGRKQQATASAIPDELNLQNGRGSRKTEKAKNQLSTRQKATPPNNGAATVVPQQPSPMILGKPQRPLPHPVNSFKIVPGQPRTTIPPTMVGEFGGPMQQNIPMNEHHQHLPYDPHYASHHQQPHPYNHRIPSPAPTVLPMPSTCPNCAEMEKYIFAVEADLEYLRSVALRNEFVCSRCESDDKSISSRQSKKSQNKVVSCASVGSRKKRDRGSHQRSAAESMSLSEASQRLVDVTARHKRQIEQMTKERARWQNDMHLKLSKFAMMCKDLNEESAKRKDEATVAQSELSSARTERDELCSEVEILRARVELYEKCELENASLRDMIRSQDNETLRWADEQVKKRDDAIVDLSSRLELTLDTLEIERQQQRIRRQIIFPVGRSSSMGSADNGSVLTEGGDNNRSTSVSVREMNEQLVRAKEEARVAEASLEGIRIEAAKREEALLERCKKLERQLHDTSESSPQQD